MIRRNPDIAAVLLLAVLLVAGTQTASLIPPPVADPGIRLVIDGGLTGLDHLERQAEMLEREAEKLEQRLSDLPLCPLDR